MGNGYLSMNDQIFQSFFSSFLEITSYSISMHSHFVLRVEEEYVCLSRESMSLTPLRDRKNARS